MEQDNSNKVCCRCTNFLFLDAENNSDFGICLRDEAFDPYIDELMEDLNYESCKELVEEKKMLNDTAACEHYEEAMIIDLDGGLIEENETEVSEKPRTLTIDLSKIEEFFENLDWKTVPIDKHVKKLQSPDKKKQMEAFSSLSFFANQGNEEASHIVMEYFKNLPAPVTLDEIHYKMDVFNKVANAKYESALIPILVEELRRIESNNRTRQWITKILDFLRKSPFELINKPLVNLLKERKFSYKMKNRIEEVILYSMEYSDDW